MLPSVSLFVFCFVCLSVYIYQHADRHCIITLSARCFGGKPNANFLKAWYHALGMGAITKQTATNRKLEGIETGDISLAYRRVADRDFTGASNLAEIETVVTNAFETDALVGMNLTAVGTHLLELPEKLVSAMDLQERVEAAIAQDGLTKRISKGKKQKPTAEESHARNLAMHKVLTGELLMLCERGVSKDEPFFTNGNITSTSREALGKMSAANREALAVAAKVLSDHVGDWPSDKYQLIRKGELDDSLHEMTMKVLHKMKAIDQRGSCVILSNSSGSKIQGFDFYQHAVDSEGRPVIQMQYAVSNNMQKIEVFLEGETIEYLKCSNKVADAIADEVMAREYGEVLTDIKSGLRLIQSYLPMDITAAEPDRRPRKSIATVSLPPTAEAVEAGAASWLEGTVATAGGHSSQPGQGKHRNRGGKKKKKKK